MSLTRDKFTKLIMQPHDTYYRRNLPHIHLEGHPLFITFNLVDSLPKEIIEGLKLQREQELKALPEDSSERYKIQKKFFGKYDEWLDRCKFGNFWLKDERVANIVREKIHSMKKERYRLLAYCIMPNHVHLLIDPSLTGQTNHRGVTAQYPITDTLRLIKGGTARECNIVLGRRGSFWHHESYDHYVRDEQELERIFQYILNNPVKAGLVTEWTSWKSTYINPEFGSW